MSIYPPSEIVDWIDDREAMTADCPRCGIDAVIGSASGFPITLEFLNLMNVHWFLGTSCQETSLRQPSSNDKSACVYRCTVDKCIGDFSYTEEEDR